MNQQVNEQATTEVVKNDRLYELLDSMRNNSFVADPLDFDELLFELHCALALANKILVTGKHAKVSAMTMTSNGIDTSVRVDYCTGTDPILWTQDTDLRGRDIGEHLMLEWASRTTGSREEITEALSEVMDIMNLPAC
jgi:hypothetical protein